MASMPMRRPVRGGRGASLEPFRWLGGVFGFSLMLKVVSSKEMLGAVPLGRVLSLSLGNRTRLWLIDV